MLSPAARTIALGAACLAPAAAASAQATYQEAEPNENRLTATPVGPLAPGDRFTGTSTGGSTAESGAASADMFLVSVAPAPPAIYRHRLVLTSPTAGQTMTIRGLSQVGTSAGAWPCTVGVQGDLDLALQTSTFFPVARTLQWYGFGRGERLYVRVAGTADTTAPYTVTLERTTVTPQEIGPFAAGSITFSSRGQGHATDTEMWIYDADLNPIPGYANDDNSVNGGGDGVGFQSLLTRPFQPGVYYLAISNYSLANHLGSPCDDDHRTGGVADFPGLLVCSALSTNIDTTFSVTHAGGAVQVPAVRPGPYDVLWYRFEVIAGAVDCNANGVNDAHEIAQNPALDCFNPAVLTNPGVVGGPDGLLDACQCVGNFNRDGAVNSADVSAFLTAWFAAVQAQTAGADIDCSGATNSADISTFLAIWIAQVNGVNPRDGCP